MAETKKTKSKRDEQEQLLELLRLIPPESRGRYRAAENSA